MQIKATRVFKKNHDSKKRNVVNEGSARSSKTISICQLLITRALSSKVAITICRAKSTWLRATAMVDFFNVLKEHFNLYDERLHHRTLAEYNFINGSIVRFIGTDEHQKIHGLKSDIVWCNEANEITYDAYRQLSIRCTGQVFLDFNPSFEKHWIVDKILSRDDTEWIHSTYKDNPFLEEAVVDEIERLEPTEYNISQGTADEVLWKIYGLGLRASLRGLVFPDVDIVPCLPDRSKWKKHFYGVDFGYTNDVTAVILVVLSEGELYFKQLVYEKNLRNCVNEKHPHVKSIEGEFMANKVEKSDHIWADSAEPKSIADLQLAGYNIQGTSKGADSVDSGIEQIKQYKCHIIEDSVDLIKEKDNYKWAVDRKTGEVTNKPVDAFNHGWDAIRYGCMKELPFARNKPYKAMTPLQMASDSSNFKSVHEKIEARKRARSEAGYYE